MEGCSKSLWTVEDDGSNLTRVTGPAGQAPPGEGSFDDMPTWSPDGRFLLYRRDIFERAGRQSLWITSLDGASRFQVGPDAPNAAFGSYNEMEWSPDGRWILFNGQPADAPRTPEGNGWSAIWLLSSDGAVLRRLTSGEGGDTAVGFSPDGTRVAFIGEAGPDDPRRALLTMDLDGTDVAPVFVGTPPDGGGPRLPGGGGLSVSWSPDGQHFALGYRQDLYTLRADGTQLTSHGSTGSPASIGTIASQVAWSAEPAPALIYAADAGPAAAAARTDRTARAGACPDASGDGSARTAEQRG